MVVRFQARQTTTLKLNKQEVLCLASLRLLLTRRTLFEKRGRGVASFICLTSLADRHRQRLKVDSNRIFKSYERSEAMFRANTENRTGKLMSEIIEINKRSCKR